MIQTILDTFIFSGNTILSSGSGLFESTSLGYSTSTMLNEFDNDPLGATVTLTSTSVSLATMSGCSSERLDRTVQDTSMIVESLSLDELYELKNLVDEKGNSYKLHF